MKLWWRSKAEVADDKETIQRLSEELRASKNQVEYLVRKVVESRRINDLLLPEINAAYKPLQQKELK